MSKFMRISADADRELRYTSIIYHCKTDVEEARVISFPRVRMETLFRSPHMETNQHTKNLNSEFKNLELAVDR